MIYIITFEHDKKTAMATIGRLDEYYYIGDINVPKEIRKKGYGSKLIKAVNLFLLKQRTSGVLVDDTHKDSTFYERNGWIPDPKDLDIKYYKIKKK